MRSHLEGATRIVYKDGRIIYRRYEKTGPTKPVKQPDGWGKIRTLLEQEAKRFLSGEDTQQVDTLIERFLIETKARLHDFQCILRRKGEQTVTRRSVVEACEFLSVPIPKIGAPADPVFRKQVKRLRYENHEDRLKEAYDADYYQYITQALETLEAYNQKVGESQ
jgi:hypothetical protein